jgi:hypothetical protein
MTLCLTPDTLARRPHPDLGTLDCARMSIGLVLGMVDSIEKDGLRPKVSWRGWDCRMRTTVTEPSFTEN